MNINEPYLFIGINDSNFIFFVVKYDENFSFTVLEKVEVKSGGVKNGKIIDVEISSKILKENLKIIEKKIDFTFKKSVILTNQNNLSCINITGFKKLNGSQILNEDISYILNEAKNLLIENRPNLNLIHIFNSSFILDQAELDNLPIGLYGEFYSQQLTFFLIPKNDEKNLKLVFNKCGIDLEKIILEPFVNDLELLKKNSDNIFSSINIGKLTSSISVFYKSSFIYYEVFNFGSDIIINDVCKVCSLTNETVRKIFSENIFNNLDIDKEEKYLDDRYFNKSTFRKISFSHLDDIIFSRISEITNIIYLKNINTAQIKSKNEFIYFNFEDEDISENIKNNFKKIFQDRQKLYFPRPTQDERFKKFFSAADLFVNGWNKEAIPLIHTKKSIISRLFASMFD